MQPIYLDHAATAPCLPEIARVLADEIQQPWNASSVHGHGQEARAKLDEAREEAATALGLPPSEVLFTSGASEANNLAIRGLADARRALARPLSIALPPLEHACVRETAEALERSGRAELQWLPVSRNGLASLPAPTDSPPDLLCLMAVQNETGVHQPVEEARRLRDGVGCLWLCDATQAVAARPGSLGSLGADFYSLSSHKIGGPPGVGLLAGPGVRQLAPQVTGGPQEGGLRAGTQPIALIRGFAMALRLARERAAEHLQHLAALEQAFLRTLASEGVSFQVNGGESNRVPCFLNISFSGFAGADLVIALDGRGFSVSSGSACATGVMETSPTLAAMFPDDPDRAAGGVRITPGEGNTRAEMERLGRTLAWLVLRRSGEPSDP